jgi:hypothetical protein
MSNTTLGSPVARLGHKRLPRGNTLSQKRFNCNSLQDADNQSNVLQITKTGLNPRYPSDFQNNLATERKAVAHEEPR